MSSRRAATALCSLVLAGTGPLAGAASAGAQTPGDTQYSDPFGAQDQPSGSQQGSGSGGRGGMPLSNAPPGAQGPTEAEAARETGSSASRLAATGTDAGLVALAGAGLLLTGIGLRLHAPRRPRPLRAPRLGA
jgi:hypothetical protein